MAPRRSVNAPPTGLLLVALAAALPACGSSAPYTIPAAAINTAIAAGASAAQRSAGGCYAQCVGGTVCNSRTGFCEAAEGILCLGMESNPPSCLNRLGATMGTSATVPGGGGETVSPFGISPATGRPPPQPGSTPSR